MLPKPIAPCARIDADFMNRCTTLAARPDIPVEEGDRADRPVVGETLDLDRVLVAAQHTGNTLQRRQRRGFQGRGTAREQDAGLDLHLEPQTVLVAPHLDQIALDKLGEISLELGGNFLQTACLCLRLGLFLGLRRHRRPGLRLLHVLALADRHVRGARLHRLRQDRRRHQHRTRGNLFPAVERLRRLRGLADLDRFDRFRRRAECRNQGLKQHATHSLIADTSTSRRKREQWRPMKSAWTRAAFVVLVFLVFFLRRAIWNSIEDLINYDYLAQGKRRKKTREINANILHLAPLR